MNIYLISQNVNNHFDTYDSAVVCAKTKKHAQMIHPGGYESWNLESWCDASSVKVEFIGKAKKTRKKGVICASYNAG